MTNACAATAIAKFGRSYFGCSPLKVKLSPLSRRQLTFNNQTRRHHDHSVPPSLSLLSCAFQRNSVSIWIATFSSLALFLSRCCASRSSTELRANLRLNSTIAGYAIFGRAIGTSKFKSSRESHVFEVEFCHNGHCQAFLQSCSYQPTSAVDLSTLVCLLELVGSRR